MQNSVITIRFDKSHLSSIGERLYSQSLDLVRELVANAYDADATEVNITLENNNLIVSDNGSGMDRQGLDQYFTIGSPYKKEFPISPKYKRVRIGEFGIGKFAVLALCDRFELYTNSSSYSATIVFNRRDFENSADWTVPIIESSTGSDKSSGTRVTLYSLKKPIQINDLERHLIHIFPLNDRRFSISIDGRQLQPHYIAGSRFKIYEKNKFGIIKGEIILASLNLSKDIAGIGIRSKGVLIKREFFGLHNRHSSAVNRLTGEINADFLPITTSRSDFIKDTDEYRTFYTAMEKKLRRVIREIEKSSLSYSDRRAEKTLSDALTMIRHALRKNSDIFLPGEMPLFATKKQQKKQFENIGSTVIGKAMVKKKRINNQTDDQQLKTIIKQAVAKLRPKVRRPVKTVLRDDRRIIKKIRVGGAEFIVSFAHLGKDEKESFSEGGIIFINRDHRLFAKVGKKIELTFYHLIRLVTQELIKLTSPKNLDIAYDWQGKLIADAFLKMKEEKSEKAALKSESL